MRADLTMMVYLSFLLEERQSQLNRVGGQVVHTGFFFVFCFFFLVAQWWYFPLLPRQQLAGFLMAQRWVTSTIGF